MTKRAPRSVALLLAFASACGGGSGTTPSIAPAVAASPAPTAAAPVAFATTPGLTEILGRPTDRSVALVARPERSLDLYFEYGRSPSTYSLVTPTLRVASGEPAEFAFDGLSRDTRYYYRARYREAGTSDAFANGAEHSFVTQRAPGSSFTFAVQGDSHPERPGNMFSAELYNRTMRAVAADRPDFYLTSGDDFSVDTLRTVNEATVTERYTIQVPYFAQMAHSTPLFLVNGNHEQAARYLYNASGPTRNVPIWAQNARNRFFAQPAPDGFYSGNEEQVPGIGLLRNYYAWEWGDALFVTLDPYWSSPVAVDNVFGDDGGGTPGGNAKTANKWDITHGDAQYQWLKRTLEGSRAKWKFVFAHHVLGGGRGGVEIAGEYEWGGQNANGSPGFAANRGSWPTPIHQLMVANKVTVFFQAHDHIFVRQQLDGITYQSLPNPADNTYTAFNSDAYRTGDKFPNAGYVRVTVAPTSVLVEYMRMFLPQDEGAGRTSGMVQFSYTLR